MASRALITGGATGIGLAFARELLRNGTEKVCIADTKSNKGRVAENELRCEFGKNRAVFMKCDVTDKYEMEDLFRLTVQKFGCLDLVINNAGILNDLHWEHEININVAGLVRSSFLAIKYMGRNNGGCGGTIVNLSSIHGLQTVASVPVYVATKHAVIGFSRSLAMPFNYCRTGIRILTICPGVTITPLVTSAHTLTTSRDISKQVRRELDSMPSQNAACVAKGLSYVLKVGENGSIWVAEGGKAIYEVEIPDYESLRKCKC